MKNILFDVTLHELRALPVMFDAIFSWSESKEDFLNLTGLSTK